MKDFVYIVTLFSSMLFFSISAIIGQRIEVEDGNILYKYWCGITFVLFLFTFIVDIKWEKLLLQDLVPIFIVVAYIVIGFLTGYTGTTPFLTLGAFCLPSVCIALSLVKSHSLENIVKWADIILLLFSISLYFALSLLFQRIDEGTRYYSQELSYNAGFCFVLDLFLILFGEQYKRFKIFKTRLYKFILYLLLVYYIIILFFAGGRGALGTILVGSLLLTYSNRWQSHKSRKYIYYLISFFVIAFFLFPIITSSFNIKQATIFTRNTNRVFSFFTATDMYERTSGRDIVFKRSLALIEDKPIIGYGLFSYKPLLEEATGQNYPHNIFLEILLQGGVIFLFIALVVLWHFFAKLIRMLKWNPIYAFLLPFVAYSFTLLLYSGSYMQVPFFWFCLAYVYNYRLPSEKVFQKLLFIRKKNKLRLLTKQQLKGKIRKSFK